MFDGCIMQQAKLLKDFAIIFLHLILFINFSSSIAGTCLCEINDDDDISVVSIIMEYIFHCYI